jgi:hypothetical protein
MKREQAIEKIYELIEQFDIDELSENEKSFVLKHISYAEYLTMRSTIVDTNELFSKFPGSAQKDKGLSLKKLAVYPVALYKIAVAIILLIGIGFLLRKNQLFSEKELLAVADTIYIEKNDTVVLEKTETIEVIKTKIVYKDLLGDQNLINQSETLIAAENYQRDCSREICPDDMIVLSRIQTKGDFSEDSTLTDFIVTMN